MNVRPARILSPFLAPCKRLEITADPNNYFPGMFRLMFRRNFRLPPTLPSTLITCPRFRPQTFVPRLNFSLDATNLNLFSAFYYTVLLFLFLFHSLPFRSSKKKNPLIDKRFSFFSFPFSASIDKPAFNWQSLRFGEKRVDREFRSPEKKRGWIEIGNTLASFSGHNAERAPGQSLGTASAFPRDTLFRR